MTLVGNEFGTPCESLAATMSQLFVCSDHGDYQRIRTPFLYPDGDNIDLFTRVTGEQVAVTDLGETLRWLRMQTTVAKRSPKQQALIQDACLTHGVELYKGMIQARVRPADNFAAVVTRVAQAALRISDIWFTLRFRSVESATDDVADFLQEARVPFVRREPLAGRSGRTWNVDFHTRLPVQSSLVYVLSTGSRSAARSVANQVVAAWHDLNHFKVGPEAMRFVSLFDDTADVWSPEDFRLVESLSTISRWSEPQQFLEVLQAA